MFSHANELLLVFNIYEWMYLYCFTSYHDFEYANQ